jgi:hypothetical protein
VKIKYDSTEVDRSKEGDFVAPKPGVYRMKIESCTYEEESSQGPRIVVMARMDQNDADGNGNGYGFWDYVGLKTDWKVDQWLQAIGFDTEDDPEGEFDTSDFVGKTIMGRVKEDYFTRDGEDHPTYKPKLARALPFVEGDDEEAWDAESEMEESVEEEPEETDDGDEDMPFKEDMTELGELADEGDEDAIGSIYTLCQKFVLDSDEFDLWSEAAEAVAENLEAKPKPKPVKKAPAKKAPAKKAAAKKPDPEPDAEDDYDSWSVADLKEELESRELSQGGGKTALIARLRKNDNDPF